MQMGGTGKYHPEWGNPITKEYTWYAVADKWILAQRFGIPNTIHISSETQEEGRSKYGYSGPSWKGEQNTHRRRYRDKVWSRVWGKDHPETTPPSDPSHIQLQNPDTIVDAHKCWLTRAEYCYHLGGSASTWQILRGTLSPSHWTEHRVPKGGPKELKELAAPLAE